MTKKITNVNTHISSLTAAAQTTFESLLLYILCVTILHIQYLTPNCCAMFLFVNYCSDMFRPQILAMFGELVSFLMCATYVSSYLTEVLHV